MKSLLVVAVLGFFSSVCLGQDWYLHPAVGRNSESNDDLFGAKIGRRVRKNLAAEAGLALTTSTVNVHYNRLSGEYASTSFSSFLAGPRTIVDGGMKWKFGDRTVTPFAFLGAGIDLRTRMFTSVFAPQNQDAQFFTSVGRDKRLFLMFGGGGEVRFSRTLGLRLQLGDRVVLERRGDHSLEISGGPVFRF